MGTYFTPSGVSQYTHPTVRGSRFIGTVAPAATPEEAMAEIRSVRAQLSDAGHHCWAWRLLDGQTRSSDDREPSGSAGRPILDQLSGHSVENAVVIVSRWFGGVRLGIGGLVRAYGGCAGRALDEASLRRVERTTTIQVRHAYDNTKAVAAVLHAEGLTARGTTFDAEVTLLLDVPVAAIDRICAAIHNATRGHAQTSVVQPSQHQEP